MQTYKYYLRTSGILGCDEERNYKLLFQRLLRESMENGPYYRPTEEEREKYRDMFDRVEYDEDFDVWGGGHDVNGVTVHLKVELPEFCYDWLESKIGTALRDTAKAMRPEDVRCGQIDAHGLFAFPLPRRHLEFRGTEGEKDDSFEKAVNSISDAGMTY